MNLVDTSALYLNYPHAKLVRVTKLLETANKLFVNGTPEYDKYLVENTYNSDVVLRDIMSEMMFAEYRNTSGSHDYMGVTVYKNPDRTYSCPELGIYSIDSSQKMKEMIKNKRASTNTVKENTNLVIDNIFKNYVLSESEFIEYILENITSDEYKEFGGLYFADFVNIIQEIAGNDGVPNSLIQEGYVFDEGFGDFVRGTAARAKTAVEDGVDRHNNANTSLGNALSTPNKTAGAVADKVKAAVAKTFNKKNLRGVGAVVNAAASGVNKVASTLARGAEVGVKTFDNINTDALETKRAELRAKNAEDPKAKIDREAEAAPSSKPEPVEKKKKMLVKDKEAMYDKVMKEDLLEAVKEWLDDSEIFETEEELDEYIMNEMTSEDLALIIDSLSIEESVSSIARQQAKMAKKDADAKVRKANSDSDKAPLKNTVAYYDAKDEISKNHNDKNFEPSKRTTLGKPITPPKERNAVVPVSKSYNKPSLGFANKTPERYNSDAGKQNEYSRTRAQIGIRTAAAQNAKRFELSAMTDNEASRERVRKQIFKTAGDNYQNFEPSKPKSKGYGKFLSNGKYTALSKDNLTSTPLGKYNKTKAKVANTVAAAQSKPSNIVSNFASKTKNFAGKILKKLSAIKESSVINWLSDRELVDITCWLIENNIFEYQEELVEYLNEDLTWKEFHTINENIEEECLDIIVEALYGNYSNSYEILDILIEEIGDDYFDSIIAEEIGNDSDVLTATNREPFVKKKSKNVIKVVNKMNESKDCNCNKKGCKPCDKRAWETKLYSKVRGK